MEIKSALVTGSRSFIGKYLVDDLVNQGVKVHHANQEFFGRTGWAQRVPKVDAVFNLAAAGSKTGRYTDSDMFNTNVVQLRDLVYTIQGTPRIVQFGSSSEYGMVNEPMQENMPNKPRFMYATTKAMASDFVLGYGHEHNLPITVVRPFSVYGVGMQDTKFIPTIINAVKKDNPISIIDGQHDFIHIVDVLNAIRCIISNRIEGIVNVGSGIAISNSDLVNVIFDEMGKSVPVNHVQNVNGSHSHSKDSPVWVANCDKLKSYGWETQVSLHEGIKSML